jgi:hypothetical protein
MRDVGIGEQDVGGLRPNLCAVAQSLANRPQLAGPSRRQGAGADHLERTRLHGREAPADRRRVIVAVVVDQDHGELPRIILRRKRGQRLRDVSRLVARGYDRDHGRPRRGRRWRFVFDPGTRASKAAPPEQQVKPDGESNCGQRGERRHGPPIISIGSRVTSAPQSPCAVSRVTLGGFAL